MKLIVFLSVFLASWSLACLNCRRRKTCEDDTWNLINRTLGGWCVKVITETSITNYSTAAEACNNLGAVLSSIESEAEMDIELNLINDTQELVFLGSQLVPECNCGLYTGVYDTCYYNSTINCTFYTVFEWTDNFTVGSTVLDLNAAGSTGNTEYYQFMVLVSDNIYQTSDVQIPGLLSLGYSLGALCGKKAT